MKSFTGFKYQQSVLKTVDEPPVKKKFNWDRFSFLCVLALMFVYIGYRIYNKVTFIKVHGQVILDKMAVNFTDDIRLEEICVVEGDEINSGDTLFVYTFEDQAHVENQIKNITHNINSGGDNTKWYDREILNVKRQIAIKRSEQKGVGVRLAGKKLERKEQEKQILLGVDVAYKLPPIDSDIIRFETDHEAYGREIKILKNHLYLLRKQQKTLAAADQDKVRRKVSQSMEYRNSIYYYASPVSGEIGQINNSPNEVCYKAKDVMVIHQLENLKIKAYFHQSLYQEIKLGEEVEIEFPDGTIGRGVINNFYVSTYELPAEFQKRYEPVERRIVVDVLPLNLHEAALWIGYYKMAVTVVKKKTNRYDF